MSNVVTAPAKAAWGGFKLGVIIGAIVLALTTGWTLADAEAIGGHLWAIGEILWDGLTNIWGTAVDNI